MRQLEIAQVFPYSARCDTTLVEKPTPAWIIAWHTLVFAAYALIQYRRIVPLLSEAQATSPPLAEVLTEHQSWHARQTVLHIAQHARKGASDDELLAALFPTLVSVLLSAVFA